MTLTRTIAPPCVSRPLRLLACLHSRQRTSSTPTCARTEAPITFPLRASPLSLCAARPVSSRSPEISFGSSRKIQRRPVISHYWVRAQESAPNLPGEKGQTRVLLPHLRTEFPAPSRPLRGNSIAPCDADTSQPLQP